MERIDRLTSLVDRFSLSLSQAPVAEASLVVTNNQDGIPQSAIFRSGGLGFDPAPANFLFAARVDWGRDANPLLSALPEVIEFDLSSDTETRSLISALYSELASRRCGSRTIVNRLGEVLFIRLLRAQVETGSTRPGLLAGLSDPRLSRAIVAMHDQPGHDWRIPALAIISGLSTSRFVEDFSKKVGETPGAYLRNWRLTLARQDVARGDRVDVIARRYGYTSPEGFARAFKARFGTNPIRLRNLA